MIQPVVGQLIAFVDLRSSHDLLSIMHYEDAVINSLPNNKILDWSKLKAFADNKINLTKKSKFVLGRVENIVGKGENAGYQHFLLFSPCFQKPSHS